VLKLASAISKAAAVWYNVTKDKTCFEVPEEVLQETTSKSGFSAPVSNSCAACPPCDDCPPCPVSQCLDDKPCNFTGEVPKTFSWEGITCNDDLSQIDAKGLGRDIFWPPTVPSRDYTVESIVGPHTMREGCASQYNAEDLRGAPAFSDPWSGWLTSYYGGRNISHHRNIVWSNGALDPWSGQGVYPEGGGPDGPLVQNISKDGSQIALVLDLGAHHLDLMFPDPRDPPCASAARDIEKIMIKEWCQEAYDASASNSYVTI